jgi:hypothetical protein
MMPTPDVAWWISRLVSIDEPVNGDLSALPEPFGGLVEELARAPFRARSYILRVFMLGYPYRGALLETLKGIDPRGPAPAVAPRRLTAHLGDLAAYQSAGRFLWPGWIVRGHFNLLSSDPKVGKTHLALDLARRIYHGLAWPDGQPATLPAGTKTLWVCGDRHQDELRERAEAFGLPLEALLLNAAPDEPYGGWDLDDPRVVADLRDRVECERPGLAVVDTFWRATRRQLHRTDEVNALVGPLITMAQETDTAVLGLMHLSRDNETLGRRLEGSARAILKLHRPDPAQRDRRKLSVIGNFKEPEPLGVTLHDGGCDFDDKPPEEPVGSQGGRPPDKREAARAFIIDALTKQNDRKATELCSEWVKSGEAEGTFWNARDAMVGAGQLTSDGKPKIMHLIPAQQPPPP